MNIKKTSQPEITYPPRQRGHRLWAIRFALLLGLPLIFYYGYCWGMWGRSSLLLQYLFQCGCPPASEEARYPDEVDVVIPACRNVNAGVWLLPSGRFLYFREEKSGPVSAYFLDLQTMERIKVTNQPFSSFLTDELWFVNKGTEDYILDRTTGKQYPIKIFRLWQADSYVNGVPNMDLLVAALHRAKQVFFIQDYDEVVVLSESFQINLTQNFSFSLSDIPGWDSDRVERFLNENNVRYQSILPYFPHEVVSPDGKFVARDDGIYLVGNNQIIVKIPPFGVRGWISNGSGVIYSSDGRCLIHRFLPFADDTGCVIEVPQPVILLRVPEEYLLPAQTP